MNVFSRMSTSFVVLLPLLTFVPAQAEKIEFVATNLVGDLWRYDYTVSGSHNFAQSEFFDIYFDANIYGALSAGTAPNADWDIFLSQPNPVNLPPFDTGIFDSFALVDNPSLAGVFSVNFIFLGSGRPGAQPFDIFDANSSLVESGLTTPSASPVPEPSTAALFLIPLLACSILVHRRSEIRRSVF